jgi:hypothetical protein
MSPDLVDIRAKVEDNSSYASSESVTG